jgi:hypothetical protein
VYSQVLDLFSFSKKSASQEKEKEGKIASYLREPISCQYWLAEFFYVPFSLVFWDTSDRESLGMR